MTSVREKRPLYSACNEDSRSELSALDIRQDDTVIAIAAGGGRALSLLAAGPARLAAVDRNLDQIYSLELKAAAMQALDYDDYCGFLGVWNQEDRLARYRAARPAMSLSARSYWDTRLDLVTRGILYSGRAEATIAHLFTWMRRLGPLAWLDEIFEIGNLEDQRLFFKSDPTRMRRLEVALRAYCYPPVVFGLTRDRSFLRSTKDSIGRYMFHCVERWLEDHLARESFVFHLFCLGRYPESGPMPPYLTRGSFERARLHLDRIELHHTRLAAFALRARLHGRLKWSLSDINAWMPEREYHELLRSVCMLGNNDSRFCARNFVADRTLPRALFERAVRLDTLSERLGRTDSSVFWSFDVCQYTP